MVAEIGDLAADPVVYRVAERRVDTPPGFEARQSYVRLSSVFDDEEDHSKGDQYPTAELDNADAARRSITPSAKPVGAALLFGDLADLRHLPRQPACPRDERDANPDDRQREQVHDLPNHRRQPAAA